MDKEDQFPSPVKKNPLGKLISSAKKQMIVNMYKSKMSEVPILKYKDLMELIYKNLRIEVNHIRITISEYKKQKCLTSPSRKKNRRHTVIKLMTDKNAIYRKVYQFWFNKEMLTIFKILMAVNEDDSLSNFKRKSL